MRLLFFGDSHVAGVGDPTGAGWVGRLVAASFNAGLPVTAYNLGVRGQTSEEVLARWRAEASHRLHPDADCRAVVSFGVNDATCVNGEPRASVACSRRALAEMLDDAASMGVSAFVVGPAAVADRSHNERIGKLCDAYRDVCAALAVPYVPVFQALAANEVWQREVGADDGAHPGNAGYAELAQLVEAGGWLSWLGARQEDALRLQALH